MEKSAGIIVVGVDGEMPGDDALRFAVDEAGRTGDGLEVVTAWSTESPKVTAYLSLTEWPTTDQLEQAADQRQQDCLTRVFADEPTVTIASRVTRGEAGPVLVEASRHARMLVVGSRALGPIQAAILGSVSRYCAQHARCPVVVVPSAPVEPVESEDLALAPAPAPNQ